MDWFSINVITPSKSILYFLVNPKVLDSIEKDSFPPFKIISNAFSGILFMGSLMSNLYFSEIVSICLNIQLFLNDPRGLIPPWKIEIDLSGIINSRFTFFSIPKPLHRLHIPLGELKENEFGSGFSYEIPVVGHIKFLLKYEIDLSSSFTIIIELSPWYIAVIKLSLSLFKELSSDLTINLSITISMSWILYLSNFKFVFISIISPSTLTFKNPCLDIVLNNSL